MINFILKRLLLLVAVLLLINLFSYTIAMYLNYWVFANNPDFGVRSVPGAPPDSSLPPALALLKGYPAYLGNVLRGDWGVRLTGEQVGEEIVRALPNSLLLLGLALLIAAVLGVTLGTLSISRRTHRTTPLAVMLSVAGYSMPGFYFSILLIVIMITTPWLRTGAGKSILPISGYGLDAHLIIPVLALALRPTAEIARLTAELLSDELPKLYVRTARAKGLPWRLVVLRHALRGIATGVIVTLGNSLRYLISSLLVIEWIFRWPGVGRDMISTLFRQGGFYVNYEADLLIGSVTALAAVALLASLLAQAASWALDPRIRLRYA